MPYQYKNKTVYNYGEAESGFNFPNHKPQDFQEIQKELLKKGSLFEDEDFPANDSSLVYSQKKLPRGIEWKRPNELTKNPCFFVGGESRFDIKQGALGDCWLLAAMANLTLNHNLFQYVVPIEQDFQKSYAGIFHFRFWQYGRWIDIVIDDRLPTIDGELVLTQSASKNEFWSALLEKAYAKLYGSYEALSGGSTSEGMEDFTGGLAEYFDLQKAPRDLYSYMTKAQKYNTLMGCSIAADPSVTEARLDNGLIRGHAYSITLVRKVEINTPLKTGKVEMLRIRNPWGTKDEWRGAFADWGRQWKLVTEEEQKALNLTFNADGEFWMTYLDYIRNFQFMEMCHINQQALEDVPNDAKFNWHIYQFEGEWSTKNNTAGGCPNYERTYDNNQQFFFTIQNAASDNDSDEESKGKATVVVGIMQKNQRRMRPMGADHFSIGFNIYHVENPTNPPKPLDSKFLSRNKPTHKSIYINLREVTGRFLMAPGTYCVIPTTFEPKQEAEFLLRVFVEK